MKRIALGLALGLATTTLPAQATVLTYATSLTTAGEASAGISPATGSASVTIDDVALTLTIHEEWKNLAGTPTVSHIHCCTTAPLTGAAAVLVPFTGFPGGAGQTGSFDGTYTITSANATKLVAGIPLGEAYVNLHSSVYTGGEIRGFLTAVPEPVSAAILAAGLVATGAARRRRG